MLPSIVDHPCFSIQGSKLSEVIGQPGELIIGHPALFKISSILLLVLGFIFGKS